jgi:hypothetical protein
LALRRNCHALAIERLNLHCRELQKRHTKNCADFWNVDEGTLAGTRAQRIWCSEPISIDREARDHHRPLCLRGWGSTPRNSRPETGAKDFGVLADPVFSADDARIAQQKSNTGAPAKAVAPADAIRSATDVGLQDFVRQGGTSCDKFLDSVSLI